MHLTLLFSKQKITDLTKSIEIIIMNLIIVCCDLKFQQEGIDEEYWGQNETQTTRELVSMY